MTLRTTKQCRVLVSWLELYSSTTGLLSPPLQAREREIGEPELVPNVALWLGPGGSARGQVVMQE